MPQPVQLSSVIMTAGETPLSFSVLSRVIFFLGQKMIQYWQPLHRFLFIFILAINLLYVCKLPLLVQCLFGRSRDLAGPEAILFKKGFSFIKCYELVRQP